MSKRTLVLGASEKRDRYANKAIRMLKERNIPFVAHGNKTGDIDGDPIVTDFPSEETFHTVTLYLSAKNQAPYITKIISLNPERVIFNPGTENLELEKELDKQGIAFEHACTLVLLSTGTY